MYLSIPPQWFLIFFRYSFIFILFSYKLYSIYDKDAKEFGPLFNAKNDIVASRYVEEMIKDVNHVDSYALYCMGEFDTENGITETNVSFVSDCSNLVDVVEDVD